MLEALGLVGRRDAVSNERMRRLLAQDAAAARRPKAAAIDPLSVVGSAALSAPRGRFGKRSLAPGGGHVE